MSKAEFIAQQPFLTPRQMYERLEELGYIGQEKARKAVSLMAFRHINRLRKLHVDEIDRQALPPKDNHLLIGPTGCGKTFLIELLFREILQLPTVIIDITSYSETGYIGQDVASILTRLINQAHGDLERASMGIVCIDEFDKISSGSNTALFSGQGTTKDVSGLGVQRELLKMFEDSEIDVPMRLSHASFSERVTFSTSDVAFVACGAFSGFKEVLKGKKNQVIGFGGKKAGAKSSDIAYTLTQAEVERAANFQSYGIMPELIGRFTRIIPFRALNEADLKLILDEKVLKHYQKELQLDDIALEVDEKVLDQIVQGALKRETGARGIRSLLAQYIEEACFDAYSETGSNRSIHLYLEEEEVQYRIDGT